MVAVSLKKKAGMVITKSDEKTETACIEFLKWFTLAENNINFSITSGYLPVKSTSNDLASINAAIESSEQEIPEVVRGTLTIGAQMMKSYTLYTNKAFESGYDARKVVENSMMDQVNADLIQIEELVASGMPRAEAAAQFTTEEHFDEWLNSFTAALESIA